ncbi:MAG: hypothetical protein KJ718_05250 [Nanoarchaeota archaeon]|nr:hypothetical protein [Nanoarchaeota archaeon]MBU1051932.1 hypothetical protein [Nanoarchaeota archaeon]MBU1988330.1 hypothetical protein [Nanoarchaeota archaeon]
MRKTVIFTLFTGLFLTLMLQSVSAYTYRTYDFYYPYGSAYYNSNYGYGYTTPYAHEPSYYYEEYPALYRKIKYSGTKDDPVIKWISKGDDWEEKVKRARADVWVAESHDWRYNIASGRASGEVFGGDEKPATSPSNWRYKEAYDPRVHGPQTGYTDNYYYKPRFDSENETWDWKY